MALNSYYFHIEESETINRVEACVSSFEKAGCPFKYRFSGRLSMLLHKDPPKSHAVGNISGTPIFQSPLATGEEAIYPIIEKWFRETVVPWARENGLGCYPPELCGQV